MRFMRGPMKRFDIRRRYRRGELFIKQNEAASRKGVAGSMGSAIPAMPSASSAKPAAARYGLHRLESVYQP